MGKIIKDSSGKVLLASGGAFEVTAAIDSNIVAGNIKKDVEILGVTGTYEGSGGGGAELTFYTCSSNSGTRGGGGSSVTPDPPGPVEPGLNVNFYCSYPSNGRVPVALILYDANNVFGFDGSYNNEGTALISTNTVISNDSMMAFSLVSLTETLATLNVSSATSGTFDPSTLQAAPIYAINYPE